jgi:hypothetical protein
LFDFLKTKKVPQPPQIRDTLFGDMPMSRFLAISSEVLALEPWSSFLVAKQLIDSGEPKAAAEDLQQIIGTPQLESRHYLQAWHFLRELGMNPHKDEERTLLGVVVEVGMEKGLDLVAAYPDHHARYYNFSGAGVVWERPNDLLDKAIDDLLRVGMATAQAVGVWKENRPPAPARGQARINLLTPGGLRFGQGPIDALGKDRLGGPVLASAFRLMQALINLTKK